MPPYAINQDSSDSDGPESHTHTQSKRSARQNDSKLHKLHTAQKQKRKTANRERDRKLKERAALHSAKHKMKVAVEGSRGEAVHEKVEQAMREAEDENGEESEDSGHDNRIGLGSSEDEDEDEEMVSVEEGEEVSDESGRVEELFQVSKDDLLPDHIFTAAFKAASAREKRSQLQQHVSDEPSLAKKRFSKKSRQTVKDVFVG